MLAIFVSYCIHESVSDKNASSVFCVQYFFGRIQREYLTDWHGEILVLRNVSFSRNLDSALKFSHILFPEALGARLLAAARRQFFASVLTKVVIFIDKFVLSVSTAALVAPQQPKENIFAFSEPSSYLTTRSRTRGLGARNLRSNIQNREHKN